VVNDVSPPHSTQQASVPQFAKVALPVPLGQAFTYSIPENKIPVLGARVLVEFGRRKCLGVVIDTSITPPSDVPPEKIKPLLHVLDEGRALPDELRLFLLELARYYIEPVGEVIRLALPALERATAEELEKEGSKKLKAVGRLVQSAALASDFDELVAKHPPLKGNSAKVVAYLRAEGPTEVSRLVKEFSTARVVLKHLASLGLVTINKHEKESDPFFSETVARDTPPELTPHQRESVEAIIQAIEAPSKKEPFLLEGVTASGKTEVYLHAARHALSLGKGVILLVPEIALTPQLVHRFRARLGDQIAVLHSGLSEHARLSMWRSLRAGELRVVVGARSALFAPVMDLGLICVDEEHDGSYKQEDGVRYNARDMALLRAHRANAVAVVGSATPSLASEAAVMAKKMRRLKLPTRAHHAASLPEVELIDLTRYGPGPTGDPLLSLPLHRAIEQNLKEGGQTILFLNRRGFAPSLICADCGSIAQCPHCSVALTVHRDRGVRLECHYCDYQCPLPSACEGCRGVRFCEEGLGTERVESLLCQHFEGARVARLDRDVAGGIKSEKILQRMRGGEIDILIGTQMVTKGHDLPGVTLVGVLNADAALSLPDFRAAERTFHLLVQVAGRAGRADTKGKVLIQTRSPEHPAIIAAKDHNVRRFIEHELSVRKEVNYPPFSHLALVRLDSLDEGLVKNEAHRLALIAERVCPDVEILGPAPAPLARLRGRFRYRFLLRSNSRKPLRTTLLELARAPIRKKVRMSLDIDPVNML
jgi:primosomal protein N' (replication factor Y) (superfamily II helicase)